MGTGARTNASASSGADPRIAAAGDLLPAFVADVRALLEQRTPTGRFWDWPGDTVLLIAHEVPCVPQ